MENLDFFEGLMISVATLITIGVGIGVYIKQYKQTETE
jgi:uncharacterized membrane protein